MSNNNHLNDSRMLQQSIAVPQDYVGTDMDNAILMRLMYGNIIRYVPAWRRWLIWNESMWKVDDMQRIYYLAKKVPVFVNNLALQSPKKSAKRKMLFQCSKRLQSKAAIESMLSLLQSEKGIPMTPDSFDSNQWLLNVKNGTLNLRNGDLYPHRQDDYITKLLPFDYRADATCPHWDKFLGDVTLNNSGLIKFLQKSVGYSLTGLTTERCFFILFGTGCNGKSLFLSTVRNLLSDYAKNIATTTLITTKFAGIGNDIARLKGTRLATASETEEGQKLAENLLKQLSGGVDSVTARFLYCEPFEFTPTHKLFIATNHLPNITSNDEAIWDRIKVIPFQVRIPEDRIDRELHEKLNSEMPGILKWAVDGCRLWQKEGLMNPETVQIATANYRSETDIIAQFIQDCCDLQQQYKCASKNLYIAYKNWTKDNGYEPLSHIAFSKRLKSKGFEDDRGTNGIRLYNGLKLCAKK